MLNCRFDRHQVLSDLFEISAISIANGIENNKLLWQKREKRYIEIIKKYSVKDRQILQDTFLDLCSILSNSCKTGFDDYLGKLYMMSETSSNKTGQFFTPYHLSVLSAETLINKELLSSNEFLTVFEPSCGSGGMILALADVLWNKHKLDYSKKMFAECSDIDQRCVHMTYVQLSLAGIPAVDKNKNAVTGEVWDKLYTPALVLQWERFNKFLRKGEIK